MPFRAHDDQGWLRGELEREAGWVVAEDSSSTASLAACCPSVSGLRLEMECEDSDPSGILDRRRLTVPVSPSRWLGNGAPPWYR